MLKCLLKYWKRGIHEHFSLVQERGGAGRGRRQNCIFWVSLATCKIIHLHKFEDKVFPSLTIRPLARVGEIYDFDLARFTLNFDNLELSYWSKTPQCSFSGCHSVTVYGLGANSISLIYFSLLLLPLKKHALERENLHFLPYQ